MDDLNGSHNAYTTDFSYGCLKYNKNRLQNADRVKEDIKICIAQSCLFVP